jgi:hypothetical protein
MSGEESLVILCNQILVSPEMHDYALVVKDIYGLSKEINAAVIHQDDVQKTSHTLLEQTRPTFLDIQRVLLTLCLPPASLVHMCWIGGKLSQLYTLKSAAETAYEYGLWMTSTDVYTCANHPRKAMETVSCFLSAKENLLQWIDALEYRRISIYDQHKCFLAAKTTRLRSEVVAAKHKAFAAASLLREQKQLVASATNALHQNTHEVTSAAEMVDYLRSQRLHARG